MNTPDPQILDTLMQKLSSGSLSDEERQQLEHLIQTDESALELYVELSTVDALLHFRADRLQKNHADSPIIEVAMFSNRKTTPTLGENSPRRKKRTDWSSLGMGLAICLAIAILAIQQTLFVSIPDPPLTSAEYQAQGWSIRPQGNAAYEILGPTELRLTQGELYVRPVTNETPESAVTILTPSGKIETSNSRMIVSAIKPGKDSVTKSKSMVRLFVLAGAAILSNSSGDVTAQQGEFAEAAKGETPEKLQKEGHYKEAFAIYERLVLDPKHSGSDCASDLGNAVECLRHLGRTAEFDALVEKVIELHSNDWHVLFKAAESYWYVDHSGSILENKFVRATPGGRSVGVTERDRIRALQLMRKIMPQTSQQKTHEQIGFYSRFSDLILGGRQLWNLQTLTNIDRIPDLEEPTYWSHNSAPPVNEHNQPIFYDLPQEWRTAANDGARWRWLLDAIAKADPDRAVHIRLQYADFLHNQFGVHTSGSLLTPQLTEGKLPPEGRYTTHTLAENETIARLATGVSRFSLPDAHNFVAIYQQIAAIPFEQPPNPLNDLTCKVYQGNWRELPDFTQLKPISQMKVESGLFDLAVTDLVEHYGIVFEGQLDVPKSGEYTFQLQSDDGTKLYIGDQLIMDHDGCHGMDQKTATIQLSQGKQPIKLEFFQQNGPEGLILHWHGAGAEKRYLSAQRSEQLPQETALEKLAYIHENRRQLAKAATYWQQHIDRFGSTKNRWKEMRRDQIVKNWIRLPGDSIFPAGKNATLHLHFRNATQVKFTATKLDVEKYLADIKDYLRSDPPQLDGRQNILGIGHRLIHHDQKQYLSDEKIEWSRGLSPAADHWTTTTNVETPLDNAGVYVVEARANDGNVSRTLCWITDTVIVEKRGDQQKMYFVADASTGEPIAEANVEVFAHWTESDKTAKRYFTKTVNFSRFTNENGMVITDVNDVDDSVYARMVIARHPETGRFGVLGNFARERLRVLDNSSYNRVKAWCLTDRPVYRPSQNVHIKSWVRLARYDLDNVSAYGNREFLIRINDPSRKEVFKKRFRTDEFGGIDTHWQLDQEAMLGDYRIQIIAENFRRPGSSKIRKTYYLGDAHFRVEEYKKPEYEVAIEAPSEPVKLGDKFEATIKANYYFGAPVTNASVKYKVTRTNTADTFFPAGRWDWFYGAGYWWWGYDYSWYPGWSRWCLRPIGWFRTNPAEVVLENTVPIGKDGTVKISIDSTLAKERFGDTDHKFSITAEVVDESRRTITGSGSVIAARNPIHVYVWMNGGYFRTGRQMTANFKARTPDGKGVPGKGKATLYKISFDESGKPSETEVQTWDVETDDSGEATLSIKAQVPGQYRLAYSLTDAQGQTREGATLTRIVGEDVAKESDRFRFNDLELVLDQAEYKPGDRAKLLINTNRVGSTIALFVRPVNGVYPQPKFIKLDAKSTIEEIEIAKQDMPNIHVEAFTVANGQFYSATKQIVVPPEKRMLHLTVEPSAEEFEPGEKAKVQLKLTDHAGKPFVGTTVISIYDKSLEAIAASSTPEIRSYFWKWQRRHRQRQVVSLHHSFGELLAQGEVAMDNIGSHWLNRYGWNESPWGLGILRKGVLLGDFEGMSASYDRFKAIDGRGIPNKHRWGRPTLALGRSFDSESVSESEANSDSMASPKVRSKFADTALWTASISTDKNGIAEIELPMPENLTTWTIKAWSMGHGTRVGHGTADVITSKDVLVRLQTPRFIVENDEVTISANVHNYSGADHDFQVRLELDGDELQFADRNDATQSVRIQANQDQRLNWMARAVREGTTKIRVTTTSRSVKGDSMELSLPVLVHGMLKTESTSLAIREGQGSGTLEFTVPEKRRPELSHLELRYSPSMALAMVDALPYLAGYPYKNSESAMSRLAPLVITQRILKELNIDLDAVHQKRINLNPQEIGDAQTRAAQWKRHNETNPIFDNRQVTKLIERNLRDLTGMQNRDGGWGWFGQQKSTAHNTAYVVHGLQIAEANGAALVPGVFKKGLEWLENHQNQELQKLQNAAKKIKPWKTSASNTDAFVFMVLVDAGKHNNAMAKVLYRDRLKLSRYCQGMLGLAVHKTGDDAKRNTILRNLNQFLVEDDENQTASIGLNRRWRWYWYGNDIEANAYYLKLLCAAGQAKQPTASRVAKFLLNNRKHATYWNSTRDTAIVVEALADYVRASGEFDPDLNIEILVDGKKTKEVRITKDNLFSYDNLLSLDAKTLTSGKHTIQIKRFGTGNLYANAYLTYFTLEDFITKTGLEIKVERRYYKLVDEQQNMNAANTRGNVVDYRISKKKRISLATGDAIESGDRIEVELLLSSKNDYEYLQFSDPKPAGCESVSLQSGNRWLGGVHAYMELRDEKIDFFVRRLSTGRHSLTYQLRAEIPGKFSAMPATGLGVYAPELKANSDEFKLTIGEKN